MGGLTGITSRAPDWLTLVSRDTLRGDALAGLTGAAIVLPQAVAFAAIAGLPPEYGLYTAMIPPIIAALFGSSLVMVSGPTTAISDNSIWNLQMIKDRYGKALSSEDAIVIFDTGLDYDSELFETTLGLKLKDFDKSKFSDAYEMDVGGGADWPAVVYEVLQGLIPFSAIAAAFFYGDRIEKSALAWKRMAGALLSLIPKHGFTDANGAALLALDAVFEATGAEDVKLLAYTWADGEMEFFDVADKATAAFELISKMDEIQPRDTQFGSGLHSTPIFLFKFEADGEVVLARVRSNSVDISRYTICGIGIDRIGERVLCWNTYRNIRLPLLL